jgi:hypothetical protein
MKKASIIGLDLAKRSFQAHGALADGRVAFRKKLTREKVLGFARCDHGADTVRAHICQRHRRAKGHAHSRRTCSAGLSSRSPT